MTYREYADNHLKNTWCKYYLPEIELYECPACDSLWTCADMLRTHLRVCNFQAYMQCITTTMISSAFDDDTSTTQVPAQDECCPVDVRARPALYETMLESATPEMLNEELDRELMEMAFAMSLDSK
jgi:hypothetical protein